MCYLGVLKLGAVAVSINSSLTAEEVAYILDDSQAAVVFTTGDRAAAVSRDACPSVRHVVVCEGEAGDRPDLDRWLKEAHAALRAARLDPHEPAALLYTSGTTGFPKGATLSHGNVVSNAWSCVHHMGYRPDDRIVCFLPLFHVFGQNAITNAAFTAGAAVVLHRRFVPERILESAQADRLTVFPAVPTVYITLLDGGAGPEALPAVRYWFSAAATLPREVGRQWTERFGQAICEGYGLTETSPFATYNHDVRHKFGSVGSPIENVEVRIVDEDDEDVPVGALGQIVLRGPGVMQGYWGKPEETARALRGGWFHSGDVGSMDDEGYVFIVDRLKDMINVAGFKVWPAEVENVLYRFPGVVEAAVYAAPDRLRGEAVAAAVVLRPGTPATAEPILEFCRGHLARYKVPERVEFVAALPKNPTGKVLKRVLRERARQGG